MPAYEYQCVDCGCREKRVAGLDDHTAVCIQCGSLMLRLDDDIFSPYFKDHRNDLSNGLSVLSSEMFLEGQ